MLTLFDLELLFEKENFANKFRMQLNYGQD